MQLNNKLTSEDKNNDEPHRPRNLRHSPIYYLELPRALHRRSGVVSPAELVKDLAIAKEMVLHAAKNTDLKAIWSPKRKTWLLVSKSPFEANLASFCNEYAAVLKLMNRKADYAMAASLLETNV